MPLTKPRQSTGLIEPHAPDHRHGPDERPAVFHWQSLVDRRLIGAIPPLDPAAIASIHAAEAALSTHRRRGVW